ncbi:MAG: aspartate aminotransferase family protein [Desulfobacterales bacterium]|nr:aspartate aminotransferase family protein [Desulfobacterales bacterium]
MTAKVKQILDMNAFSPDSARTTDPNSLLGRRLNNFGAASVLFYRNPIEMAGGHGAWLTAKDGTQYLDFYNNVPSVGHTHPKVVEAVSTQVGKLNINTRYLSGVVDDYLDRLKKTFPDYLDNILMCCTGSEANDLALRIAMQRSGKRGFIVTETAYHGNTLAVTHISPAALKKDPLPDHVVAVPAPFSRIYGQDPGKGFAGAVKQAVAELEERGHGCAGLICDSIFSSDGVISDPPGFLSEAAAVVKKAGGLFIADEVQPGFARTGTHMWGFQRHNLSPDLVTMGKPMGNGFPMAGVAAKSSDVKRFCEHVGYFNTFGGNPVAAAAGQAVLDIIEQEGLMENAHLAGSHAMAGLKAIRQKHSQISDIRGCGLFIGMDLCVDGDPDKPDPALASDLINALKRRHILIGAAGKYGNTLKLRPPLCLSIKEVDIFMDSLSQSLNQLI